MTSFDIWLGIVAGFFFVVFPGFVLTRAMLTGKIRVESLEVTRALNPILFWIEVAFFTAGVAMGAWLLWFYLPYAVAN